MENGYDLKAGCTEGVRENTWDEHTGNVCNAGVVGDKTGKTIWNHIKEDFECQAETCFKKIL